ncbi:MAG: translation initiation factor IF-2, partial [Candidatus Fimimonas sp.]
MTSIKLRETEFAKQPTAEVEQSAVEVAPAAEPKKEEPKKVVAEKTKETSEKVAEQPKAKTETAEKVVEQPKEEKAEKAKVAEQPKVAEVKPVEEKPAAPKVVVTIENGREVKTYTDEKGNVRVRKFLDTSAKRTPPKTDNATARPQNGSRFGKPATGTQKPQQAGGFAKKDADARPTTGGKPQQKRSTFAPAVDVPRAEPQKSYGNKNKTKDHPDEKRAASKKSLITRDYSGDYDEDKIVRRARTKKADTSRQVVAQKITNAVVNSQDVPIKVLSEKIGVPVSEIISQLFKEGIMKTINDSVDFDYAAYIASLHDVTLELKMDKTAEEIITGADDDGLENDTKRAPIVTVMGHVDHGKTSLLDAIRHTNVTSGEAGGITQHIGAYQVTAKGETITFIDTPGHAAFTAMRARGAKITDVAIIVVAADDGVMPQTIEAINHAKAADVSIIVAINKMDKPHVDPERVKQQLTEYGLLAEEWGGDTIMVPVSAKSGMGIDTLLESVLLVTEIKELKANPKKRATGTVLEAKLDKGRGPVATILVANGTLNVGDSLIAGSATGKIRAMFDDKGRKVKSAGPSMPVEVLGFSEVPQAGDYMYVADEKLVKKAAEERRTKI